MSDRPAPAAARFTTLSCIKITLLGFGLSALWSSLHSIVLPIRLLDFVAESQKNSALGYLTFAGLVVAMLVQPVVGAASDRSGFRWGRRRPFILAGTVAILLCLPWLGVLGSYAAIFGAYCLLQVSANLAQGPYQGLIPDLVPPDRRGQASGVKGMLELLGGILMARLAAAFMGRYSPGEAAYWLWLTLLALGAVLLLTAVVTLLTVHEHPGIATGRTGIFNALLRSFRLDLRRQRAFLWFLLSRSLLGIPGVVLQTFALYYLSDVIGTPNPATAAATLLMAVGGGLLAAVYFAGRLSDRVGRRPVVLLSGALGTAGIIGLLFAQSLTAVLLAGVLIGLANGAMLSSTWALATDLAPVEEGARYLGLTNLALAAGSALARLVGPVIDHFNRVEANLGYTVMLAICLVCFAAGSVLVLAVRPARA